MTGTRSAEIPGVGFQGRHQVVESDLHRRQGVFRAKTAAAPMALSVELLDIDQAVGIEIIARNAVIVGIKFLDALLLKDPAGPR